MTGRNIKFGWRNQAGPALGLALLLVLAGCGTARLHNGFALPQVHRFPPTQPAQVRLPVEIVFPRGGDVFQHLSRLVRGGLKQFAPDQLKVPGFNLNALVADLWTRMQEPIHLDDDFWLVVRPETLGIGRMRTDLKRMSTAQMVLVMTARPEIVFGPKPATTPVPIPPLSPFRPGPGIFHAMSNARFSYVEATEYFRKPEQKMLGRVLSGKGDRKLTLKDLRFYGSGGRVVLEAKLLYDPPVLNLTKHPAEMTVRLWGTPRYHPKARVFDFPDLDFDLESGNVLVNFAGWAFKAHFRSDLRQLAQIPLGAKLDWMRGRMDLALNKPLGRFVRLKTQVGSFKVWDAYADEKGIEIRVSIQGASVLQVTWNEFP